MKKIIRTALAAVICCQLIGCNDKELNIDISSVYSGIAPMSSDSLVEMNDNYISNYFGIAVEDLQDYVFAMSDDPKSAETIIIFKCQDKEKRKTYETAIKTAVSRKYDELTNYNLPEEAKLVKDSKVCTKGDIVYLVISDKSGDMNKIIKDSIS